MTTESNFLSINLPLKQPLTDALRQTVLEDLPELRNVKDVDLRDRAVEAWAIALAGSSFRRLSELPGEANPGFLVLKSGSQTVHLRGVARLAVDLATQMKALDPGVDIDDDVLLAGALCHDLGKPWEFDPGNQQRWRSDASRVGAASLRHTIYGAHIALIAGLPESIAHIACCHSAEGNNVIRSLECRIIHHADETWWTTAAACGLIEEDSIKGAIKRFEPRPLKA